MKKLFISLILFFGLSNGIAISQGQYELELGSTYLLINDESLKSYSTSNQGIIDVEPITTLYNDNQQIIFDTVQVGSTAVCLRFPSEVLNYNFNVVEKTNKTYSDLIRIDRAFEYNETEGDAK
ncbi:MAG: hypothetical protein PHV37_00590 [Candidatus Gastranaerophilales bacterium]|nr:hypothetical protein [Candidatus Gastranaerophilales bacterium]